ncbi:LacI family transcriptional regulator [Delftia acidovorans]|nr:LacI family transcriptional regulator [Delftia acidovorans]
MDNTPPPTPHQRITVHDVARVAGVSIGTVSRVVNGAATVKPAARERVNQAIAELGWAPSVAAQAMRGASSHMVGFIFSDIRNPLYSAMVKGAEDVLTQHGYLLMIASSDGLAEREIALIDLFARRKADGLLFTIEEESDTAVRQSLSLARIPTVMLERELSAAVPTVGADHYGGTRQAAEYLLSLGHRRIALISGGRSNRVGRDRLRGFTDAHAAAGVEQDEQLMRLDGFSADYAFRQTQLLLGLERPPTALIAAGMHLLNGILPAIRMKGLRIPHDISLIASNDSPLAQLATPAISVIRYDGYALGREAALLLLQQLKGETPPQPNARVELPTEFVMRESCAAPKAGTL